jgi:hypothetical protein
VLQSAAHQPFTWFLPFPILPPLQFVNFKLYHAMSLRYPPVLDGKLEQAAAGLEALMSDLAGAGASGAADKKQLVAADGGAAAGGGEDEERGVNPQAEQRIGSLADKVGLVCLCVCGCASVCVCMCVHWRSSVQGC